MADFTRLESQNNESNNDYKYYIRALETIKFNHLSLEVDKIDINYDKKS